MTLADTSITFRRNVGNHLSKQHISEHLLSQHNHCKYLNILALTIQYGTSFWKTSVLSYERSQNCEKRLLTVSYFSVCPCLYQAVRMEQLSYHWRDLHENLYSSVYRKSVEKIQVSLETDTNDVYFT